MLKLILTVNLGIYYLHKLQIAGLNFANSINKRKISDPVCNYYKKEIFTPCFLSDSATFRTYKYCLSKNPFLIFCQRD